MEAIERIDNEGAMFAAKLEEEKRKYVPYSSYLGRSNSFGRTLWKMHIRSKSCEKIGKTQRNRWGLNLCQKTQG